VAALAVLHPQFEQEGSPGGRTGGECRGEGWRPGRLTDASYQGECHLNRWDAGPTPRR
jgi:hypothetical protein